MAEGTHLHVGLLRAWELWLRGRDLKGDGDAMWGLGMIWWSRIGVIAGFLGGLVIVLDIVGEDRLRSYGLARWREKVAHAAPSGHRILIDCVVLAAALAGAAWLSVALAHLPTTPSKQGALPAFPTPLPVDDPHNSASMVIAMGVLLSIAAYNLLELTIIALKSDRLMAYARAFALAMLVVSAHFTLLTS